MTNLILVAPIDGWVSALEEVPDPVFAGKMMGDGLAIDPTSATLRAPCAGEVVTLHAAKHAVTMRAANGAEILLHVGCDTVALDGDGFEAHVTQGQRVREGDPLLTFDLDGIAPRVRSLVTPVIVIEGSFTVVRREQPRAVKAGDFLMELQGRGAGVQKTLRVPFEHGIHARPAALLVQALRNFSAEVKATANGRTVNARSMVGLMELGAQFGEEVTFIATGADAAAALDAACSVGFEPTSPAPAQRQARGPHYTVRGVVASRGIAVGPAAHISGSVSLPDEAGAGIAHETAELERARGIVRAQLEQLRATSTGVARELIETHLIFIDDPELLQAAEGWIARGKSAGFAWHEAVEESAKALNAVGDPRVAERTADLRDLTAQVLRALAGETPSLDPPQGSILIGQELLPSQLVSLPAGRIAGFCTAAGGPTSHVALLAAAMNLPALVAAGPDVLHIAEGTTVVLDAEQGCLRIAPDATERAAAEAALARNQSHAVAARAESHRECRMASGEHIEFFANIGALAEVEGAIAQGAEGCGLLRTEFLFLDRDTPPDVAQQTGVYQSIVSAFGGRPVVIRTLDAGSDKPLRYLPLPHEENPALGIRGVRASLRSPELLRDQLRAILGVEPLSACRILVPMITDVAEVQSVRQLIDELCNELGLTAPLLGVMIETPASALLADRLAAVADFLSIGSNDLAQYTLAMDRGQAELAGHLDGLHPAVLRLIGISATAARAAGRSIAVCGGLASDPLAAPLLVGLGVNELSAVPTAIPELKSRLRALRLDDCRALAQRALEASSAADVRALAAAAGGD
jgi:multiphosphoryl transfer protein